VFGAAFTYDGAGNPFWFSFQPTLAEGQFTATGFQIFRLNGGSFGDTFTAPGAPVQIGTGTLTFNTCNSVTLSVQTNAAAGGLPNVNFTFERLDQNGSPATCVYTQPFTACPAGTTAVAGQARTCALTGTITQNIRLTNNARYVLQGKVQIGAPLQTNSAPTQTATITIEPGTLIRGAGGSLDFLLVNPGSRIFADGLPNAPIIFTGPTNTSGSWGGLVVAGLATNNNASQAGGTAAFEADPTIIWGGNSDTDSSGVLRYVQVRNAGSIVSQNVELNSLTLGSVGSGTVIEYFQSHNGLDDGIEFFGGTVNARYVVITQGNDDGLDFDVGGYRGTIQYAYVQAGTNADTSDGSCVESDNNAQSLNATPRAQPAVSNLTCAGRDTAPNFRRQIRIRRGSGGNYFNVVIANQPSGECLTVFDQATYDLMTPGTLSISGSALLGCATNFADGVATANPNVSTWYNSGTGNVVGALASNISGRFPISGGVLDGTAVIAPASRGFERTTYKGAFGVPGVSRDWTRGWTVRGSIP
jgi:hypothetical protein